MQLESRVYLKSSESMPELENCTTDLIITSPPYPMVEMWDLIFPDKDGIIKAALQNGEGLKAWEAMHCFLDTVWGECFRILREGGFACINIGDATRTVDGTFRLYPNHARITSAMQALGFDCLPVIHWFKPTNAPNKFMGSGMLPAGAYVTLEHEYILIFRKGRKRVFSEDEKKIRRRSAVFWEERNRWFSDVWDLRGQRQRLETKLEARERSGAFPFEVPHRLLNMYSMQGDTVVDPFLGTGTTLAAAAVNQRRCIGYESVAGLGEVITARCSGAVDGSAEITEERLDQHRKFIEEYRLKKGGVKYLNPHYNFAVVTSQERELVLPELSSVDTEESSPGMISYGCGYRENC